MRKKLVKITKSQGDFEIRQFLDLRFRQDLTHENRRYSIFEIEGSSFGVSPIFMLLRYHI